MERSDSPPTKEISSERTMSIKSIRGLRSYYPTDKGPVDAYQLGQNGRVEYLAAEIAVDHLNKGKDTTEEWRKWAKERGVNSDEAGLILSHRLGGSGIDKTNLFPKSPLLDNTTWKQHEQEAVDEALDMKKWKKIKFSARLDYPSEDSTRPSAIEYQYDLPSGSILYGKVNNTPAPTSEVATEEEEVEEEEEEEVDEEVEEEEEEEEEEEVDEKPAVQSTAPVETKSEAKVEPEPKLLEQNEEEPEVPSPIQTFVQPPTPRPSLIESSPPPVAQSEPPRSIPAYEPAKPAPVQQDNIPRKEPPKEATKEQPSKKDNSGTVITKSDFIDLLPVIGSCKLAYETVQAAFNGNGRKALRKAVQCGISLVADFYLGRAIARHGQILSNSVTEETVVRFVTKAENQIIIVSTFKATNQLLNTLSRLLS